MCVLLCISHITNKGSNNQDSSKTRTNASIERSVLAPSPLLHSRPPTLLHFSFHSSSSSSNSINNLCPLNKPACSRARIFDYFFFLDRIYTLVSFIENRLFIRLMHIGSSTIYSFPLRNSIFGRLKPPSLRQVSAIQT